MWQLIQDNFISHYHEYIGDLHHMLVALSKIQTFVFSWTPLMYKYIIYSPNLEQHLDKYIYLSILSFVLYTLCISNVFSATLSSLFDLIKVYLL